MCNILMVVLAILVMGSGVLANDIMTPQALAQTEVKPLEIEVVSIEPLFVGGGDNVPLSTTFRVNNPNSIEVTLDSLEYKISLAGAPLVGYQIAQESYIPAETEVEIKDVANVALIVPVGHVLMTGGGTLVDALVGGLSIWKQIGGTPAGATALLNGLLPGMLPEVLVTTCAKFGIPEAIAHSLAMMVVMPLLAGLLPKLVDRIVDTVWALGAEPPPTYEVEGTATMIAEGKITYINFSQSCVGTVPPMVTPFIEELI